MNVSRVQLLRGSLMRRCRSLACAVYVIRKILETANNEAAGAALPGATLVQQCDPKTLQLLHLSNRL